MEELSMKNTIKLELKPKAKELFGHFVLASALYAGPTEIQTTAITMVGYNETDKTTFVEVEPRTIVVNRSLSQRLAGRLVNFIVQNVEVASKSPTK